MDKIEFSSLRKKLNKTQRQMAQLLGVSLKAIHSYEQGWRSIPTHVERQMLFLVSQKNKKTKGRPPCWNVKRCSAEKRSHCPAWEFQAGDYCWLINGTICEGLPQNTWEEKMRVCRRCKVLSSQL